MSNCTRIGILTFQRAHNFGALLQVYALKSVLEVDGHSVEVLDYWPKYHQALYSFFPFLRYRNFFGKIKQVLSSLILIRAIYRRRKSCQSFMRTFLGLSNQMKFVSPEDLNNISVDTVIYGSDQIWKKFEYPTIMGFDPVYWGDIIPCRKKVTYAASMGKMDIDEGDKRFIRQHLRNFDQVLVRENSLKLMLESISQVKMQCVLDPVFLLKRELWFSLIRETRIKTPDKYIFFYNINPSSASSLFVDNLAMALGFDVIEVRGRDPVFSGKHTIFKGAKPQEFLYLIRHAQYVISTSFHGVAFSVLFEKQFVATGMGKNAERVQSLLENLGIQGRYVNRAEDVIELPAIDYSMVNILLDEEINRSKRLLLESLQ